MELIILFTRGNCCCARFFGIQSVARRRSLVTRGRIAWRVDLAATFAVSDGDDVRFLYSKPGLFNSRNIEGSVVDNRSTQLAPYGPASTAVVVGSGNWCGQDIFMFLLLFFGLVFGRFRRFVNVPRLLLCGFLFLVTGGTSHDGETDSFFIGTGSPYCTADHAVRPAMLVPTLVQPSSCTHRFTGPPTCSRNELFNSFRLVVLQGLVTNDFRSSCRFVVDASVENRARSLHAALLRAAAMPTVRPALVTRARLPTTAAHRLPLCLACDDDASGRESCVRDFASGRTRPVTNTRSPPAEIACTARAVASTLAGARLVASATPVTVCQPPAPTTVVTPAS